MKSDEGFLQAFSVGLSLTGMILIAGPISGACLNPAIGVTQPLFQYLLVQKSFLLNYHWIYVLATALGGVLSGTFLLLNQELYDQVVNSAENATKDEYSISDFSKKENANFE